VKQTKTVGWTLSVILCAFLIFGSAMGKFTEWEGKQELFTHLGYAPDTLVRIGMVEVCLAILVLLPKVDFFAALLLTAYLGGATATHVRVGDPFYFPVVLGVLFWISFTLRNQRFRDFLSAR
jgi:hypothetical protein